MRSPASRTKRSTPTTGLMPRFERGPIAFPPWREEIALIGQRDRRHLRRRALQITSFSSKQTHDGLVDERVLGVQPQMDEPAAVMSVNSSAMIDIASRTGSKERRCSGGTVRAA